MRQPLDGRQDLHRTGCRTVRAYARLQGFWSVCGTKPCALLWATPALLSCFKTQMYGHRLVVSSSKD